MGHAQGDLVNLYNWSNETESVAPDTMSRFISIYSNSSADFYGGFTTNYSSGFAVCPLLVGTVNTVPGDSYEVSFTMQNMSGYAGGVAESFDGDSTNLSFPSDDLGYTEIPVNVDFTAVATSTTTMVSFQCYLDPEGGQADLYNVSVTEVPESSASRLFLCGGFVLLMAKQLRKATQKQKLAVKPLA
jgi:hypothetical protein